MIVASHERELIAAMGKPIVELSHGRLAHGVDNGDERRELIRGPRLDRAVPAARVGRWFRDHRRVARDSLVHVSQRIGTSLLVWLLIGIALALPAALYLLQTNLALASDSGKAVPGFRSTCASAPTQPSAHRCATNWRTTQRLRASLLTTADAALDGVSAPFRRHRRTRASGAESVAGVVAGRLEGRRRSGGVRLDGDAAARACRRRRGRDREDLARARAGDDGRRAAPRLDARGDVCARCGAGDARRRSASRSNRGSTSCAS